MNWFDILPQEARDIALDLTARADAERQVGKIIYPPQDKIFRALDLTPPEETKVVIVGQDPYHTPGVANGLAFSVSPTASLQPSLRNIYKELCADLGRAAPANGDLTPWAERGVLLLNTTLTVYEHKANSHANWGWQIFTKEVIRAASELPQPIVFILWGSNAHGLAKCIVNSDYKSMPPYGFRSDKHKKAVIMSSHPSPLSATKPCQGWVPFINSKPFSTVNKILTEFGSEPVDWII